MIPNRKEGSHEAVDFIISNMERKTIKCENNTTNNAPSNAVPSTMLIQHGKALAHIGQRRTMNLSQFTGASLINLILISYVAG